MTSSPDPTRRDHIALLHQAATALRARFRRLQALDYLHDDPRGTRADPALLDRAVDMDEAEWALGRGELEDSRRDVVVELARRIVADSGGA